MNYTDIRNTIADFVATRNGMVNPAIVPELTGIFCDVAYTKGYTQQEIADFIDTVTHHEIRWPQGGTYDVADLISSDVTDHAIFNDLEHTLMNYKPGKAQVGPGEFFLCMMCKNSEFSVSATCGFDIVVGGRNLELKKIGTNLTSDAKFDEYRDKGIVDDLVVVKPVSNARKPLNRSKFIIAEIADWRAYVKHNDGGQHGLKAA